MSSLFEKPVTATVIEGACVIEDCHRPTRDGLCSACAILFGDYAAVVETSGGEELEQLVPADESDQG